MLPVCPQTWLAPVRAVSSVPGCPVIICIKRDDHHTSIKGRIRYCIYTCCLINSTILPQLKWQNATPLLAVFCISLCIKLIRVICPLFHLWRDNRSLTHQVIFIFPEHKSIVWMRDFFCYKCLLWRSSWEWKSPGSLDHEYQPIETNTAVPS